MTSFSGVVQSTDLPIGTEKALNLLTEVRIPTETFSWYSMMLERAF